MATFRDRPYSQFNFLVDLGTGETDTPQAGFQEVSGLGLEFTPAEYRNGNEPSNAVRKINGVFKVPDVTLKRGVIGATDLYEWINQIRDGLQQESLRTVRVQLLSEDRTTTAATWVLEGARPMKYTGPSLNGKGNEVAVEELVLACENLRME
ncbi:MAG TPA: phage tail protein [Rhodothermales bacterium]|nr:phage tail protein [Rhodothermales bacterium]